MSEIKIPESLLPSGSINLVTVKPDVGSINPEEVTESLARMETMLIASGVVTASRQMMTLIHSLGVDAEKVGILKLSRGSGILNHQAVLSILIKMSQAADKATDDNLVAKLGYAIGYVSEKLSKLSKTMNESEVEAKSADDTNSSAARRRRTFQPGTVVNAQNVQILNGATPLKPTN